MKNENKEVFFKAGNKKEVVSLDRLFIWYKTLDNKNLEISNKHIGDLNSDNIAEICERNCEVFGFNTYAISRS